MIRASRSAGKGLYELSVWVCKKLNLDVDKWELWVGLALFFMFTLACFALSIGLSMVLPKGGK